MRGSNVPETEPPPVGAAWVKFAADPLIVDGRYRLVWLKML